MKKLFSLFLISAVLSPSILRAESGDFDTNRWYEILHQVQNESVKNGISNQIINDVVQPSVFIPSIVRSDKNQAEFKLSLNEYLDRTVNSTRIAQGKKIKKSYPTLLGRVDNKYGVPPHIIMAFWGLESNYGSYKARHKLSDAFLTLMYDGRRETFFTKQLYALMEIANENNLDISKMRGSWAGAMGHFQFIPTTLQQYGVDGNGDNKIDIIDSVGDAMFSAGNYLSKLGWDKNEKVLREVKLPANIDTDLMDAKTKKNLSEWSDLGITNLDGSPLPNADMIAGLVADDKNIATTRAFLVYPNFYRIKRWNNSNWYGISVGLLSDKLK